MRGANVDISPNGLREAQEYSSVLSNLFPIMVVGGVAALVLNLRRSYYERTWAQRIGSLAVAARHRLRLRLCRCSGCSHAVPRQFRRDASSCGRSRRKLRTEDV